ncbi:hypothetical protein HDU85_002550 [Gaertneriomyces sp. JEL0708]|nr:hypothetical protein HDU85_002550 [Gaertneriomyces sp. JEL0708]
MPSALSTLLSNFVHKFQIGLLRSLGFLINRCWRLVNPPYALIADIPGTPPLRCYIYYPPSHSDQTAGKPNLPVYVNLHGGGFVGGCPDDDAEFCSYLAKTANCIVVSASYRLAPEYPYPAAITDILAVIAWVRAEYSPTAIALGGFSAGGTLALSAVQTAPASQQSPIVAVVAFFSPLDFSAGSLHQFKEQDPFKRNMYHKAYLRTTQPSELTDPVLSPVYAPASTFPPTVVLIAAEEDPNIPDMRRFINRMQAEKGDRFVGRVYEGTFHGWTHVNEKMIGPDRTAKKWDAYELVASQMKSAMFQSSVSKNR